jgi:alpha-tubulin suppressor-like RCC1 family protein
MSRPTTTFKLIIATILIAFSTTTVQAPPASAATYSQVDTGTFESCAITPSGAAKCWGAQGVLGNNRFEASTVPVQVSGLTSGVTSISVGSFAACAVVSGAAKCWGGNSDGQLGVSPLVTSTLVPVQVTGLTSGVTSISVGDSHTCAIVNGGAKCWGSNALGKLGDGTTTSSSSPVSVSGLTSGVTAIAAGPSESCAVVAGAAKCWGAHSVDKFGGVVIRSVPVQIPTLTSGVTAVATGWQHSCVVMNGAAKCWGYNDSGQLGTNGVAIPDPLIPSQVFGLTSGVSSISAGFQHTCAVVSGSAKCWGKRDGGALGDGVALGGPASIAITPTQVVGLTSSVTSIGAGFGESCAVVGSGVKCWGDNSQGQLGNASVTPSSLAVDVHNGPDGVPSYLAAEVLSPTSVRLRWTDPATDEIGYLFYRVEGSTQTPVANCPNFLSNQTTCTDTGLLPGKYYQYYVYAWNSDGTTYSGTYVLVHTPSAAPVAPIATAAVATSPTTVRVDWLDKSTDESGFKIYRYLSNGTYVLDATTASNATSALVTDPTLNTAGSAIFVVTAFNGSGETNDQGYVFSVARSNPSTTGPASPTFTSTAVTGTSATINWADNASNETGYLVYRVEGSQQTLVPNCQTNLAGLTSCTDIGLTPGVIYQYYVYSWNNTGVGSVGTSTIVKTPHPLGAVSVVDATGGAVGATGTIPNSWITLHWTNNAPGALGYNIYEFVGGAYVLVLSYDVFGPSATSARIFGRPDPTGTTPFLTNQPGTTHVYVVGTVRGADITYSEPIWATTAL